MTSPEPTVRTPALHGMGSHALEAEGLGKSYRIYPSARHRLLEAMTLGRVRGHDSFWALKDVNFRLRPGSALGICGANGAGKSTLLSVLAGVTSPTVGRFRASGKVVALLELGLGFREDLSGRDNLYLNGTLLGFTKSELDRRIGEIVDFSELGSAIDEPVRTYSSGMGLRLGFSVAIALDPDVMILDEIFAVGDMGFQRKCVDRMLERRKAGHTILFCSHSPANLRQICDECLWLDHGEVKALGDSKSVVEQYAAFQAHRIESDPAGARASGDGSPEAEEREFPRIVDARAYRADTDEERYEFAPDDAGDLRVWWENPDPERTPIQVGVAFSREDMTMCAGTATHFSEEVLEGRSGCLTLSLPRFPLRGARFLVTVYLLDGGGVHRFHEFVLREPLDVPQALGSVGLFRLDHRWDQRDLAAPESRG